MDATTTKKPWLLFLVALACLLFTAGTAEARRLESLLSPGPMSSPHAKYEEQCEECHSTFDKDTQDQLCRDCHKKVNADIEEKKGYHGLSPAISGVMCRECHSEHLGRDADILQFDAELFDHQYADFHLKDSHTQVACSSCHEKGKKFREAPGKCVDCHKSKNPHEKEMGEDCASCHNEKNWWTSSFDHDKSDFPLKGKHEKVKCEQCHIKKDHSQTPKECKDCHSLDDPHGGALGGKCQSCHKADGWEKISFAHKKNTDWELTGSHKTLKCASCHKDSPKKKDGKTDSSCKACHGSEDIHRGSMGKKCESCHTTETWRKGAFDHDKKTKFPLNGAHKKTKCIACHIDQERKEDLSMECLSCHEADDVHEEKLGRNCNDCHNETSFYDGIRFEHDLSSFPLIGLHATAPCESCHLDQEYKNTGTACFDCHKADDSHKQALGKQCSTCHSPNGWKFWAFDHDRQTEFKLKGKHADLTCNDCHGPNTRLSSMSGGNCVSCHAKDDRHRGRFGRRCEQCHNHEDFKKIEMRR